MPILEGAPIRDLAESRPLVRLLGGLAPRILTAGTPQFVITRVEIGVPQGGDGPPQYTITTIPNPPGPALYDMKPGYYIRVTVLNQGGNRNYFQAVASDRSQNYQSDVVWLDPGASAAVIMGAMNTDVINQDGSYTFSQVKVEWYDASSGTYPKGDPWEWRALEGSGPSDTPISGTPPPQGGGPPVTSGPPPGSTGPPTTAPPTTQPPPPPPSTQPAPPPSNTPPPPLTTYTGPLGRTVPGPWGTGQTFGPLLPTWVPGPRLAGAPFGIAVRLGIIKQGT